ncbi:TetR/AcrR family transcriptional regulator [Amniculibacterium sp. G2-70]|uniref:TetR/AcrR family transcriptional regulator n=1 Tax=Amniculibacterium sp. G2-70 TaxID=2767188 RepID=UPI0016541AF1|nr:TetR/AcrR family transcriptional regulator [Amniculibacterium sp. G2-70]
MDARFSEKQIHILEVAEELIAQKGFEGTSVREICTKAQVNVAMISYYFGSKEKMMGSLYQLRVQKTRQNFKEFSEIIKDGNPEMQFKEIIKFVTKQLFKYSYFHGFVTQELRAGDDLKSELTEFYKVTVNKLDELVQRGVATGVFTHAPKAEDMLTIILGSTLFVIRNKNFYQEYVPHKNEQSYLAEAEKKVCTSILLSLFASLGYHQS